MSTSLPSCAAASPAHVRGPMPLRRVLRAYLVECWFELKRMTRAPLFVIPFVVLPIGLYLLFGVVIAGAVPAPPRGAAVVPGSFASCRHRDDGGGHAGAVRHRQFACGGA